MRSTSIPVSMPIEYLTYDCVKLEQTCMFSISSLIPSISLYLHLSLTMPLNLPRRCDETYSSSHCATCACRLCSFCPVNVNFLRLEPTVKQSYLPGVDLPAIEVQP